LPDLIIERAGGVVTATLNRSERKNALTYALFDALGALFDEVSTNEADRVLVLRGAGGAFSSGMDLADRPRDGEPQAGTKAAMVRIHDAALALHRCTKPTVAVVDGVATGAGMSLALGCDLVIASERARFSAIFVRRGLSIDFGLSWILPRLVGLARAKELALFGEMISAEEALALGMIARVASVDSLDSVADALVQRLAQGPTVAITNSMALLDASLNRTMVEAVDAEGDAQVASIATDDVAEAIAAFLGKRDATFTGR
jgi:2-(1,2-epoxy-1,2-dihydrophenyl)acetyl-CoA isomerase